MHMGLALPVGEGENIEMVTVPLVNIGPLGLVGNPADTDALNVTETYTVTLVRGDRRSANRTLSPMPAQPRQSQRVRRPL